MFSDAMGDGIGETNLEVNSATPGTKGPSVTPTRNLQIMKPAGDLIAGMEIVTADHPSMTAGSRMRGLPFAMMTLAGTCDMM